MSVVKIFAFLELEQKSTFLKDLYLFMSYLRNAILITNMVKVIGWKY